MICYNNQDFCRSFYYEKSAAFKYKFSRKVSNDENDILFYLFILYLMLTILQLKISVPKKCTKKE